MRTLARWRLLIIAAVFSGTPSRALAYRPFVSTDAAVAGPGEVEIEFGYAGFRRNDEHTTIVAPTVIANLGLGHDLELVGEFKLVTRSRGGEHEQQHVAAWVSRLLHDRRRRPGRRRAPRGSAAEGDRALLG